MTRPEPKSPQDLVDHSCINFRQPSAGGLYAWELEKRGRELKVRVDGQLVFNRTPPMLTAARAGFGLAYLMDDMVEADLAEGSTHEGARRLVPQADHEQPSEAEHDPAETRSMTQSPLTQRAGEPRLARAAFRTGACIRD